MGVERVLRSIYLKPIFCTFHIPTIGSLKRGTSYSKGADSGVPLIHDTMGICKVDYILFWYKGGSEKLCDLYQWNNDFQGPTDSDSATYFFIDLLSMQFLNILSSWVVFRTIQGTQCLGRSGSDSFLDNNAASLNLSTCVVPDACLGALPP